MTGKPGVYLTPEASVRLAMIQNCEREQIIAAYVYQLRMRAQGPLGTPRLRYGRKKRKAA